MNYYEVKRVPEICGTCAHWKDRYGFDHSGTCSINNNKETFYFNGCSYIADSDAYWLSRCIKFACDVHKGLDKSGLPEILHPLRVMMMGDPSNVPFMKVRVLHDCIEDLLETTGEAEDSIINRMRIACNLSDDEIYLLKLLTHKKNQPYLDYIKVVASSYDVGMIKIDDISDNLSRDHSGIPREDIIRMNRKYSAALDILSHIRR